MKKNCDKILELLVRPKLNLNNNNNDKKSIKQVVHKFIEENNRQQRTTIVANDRSDEVQIKLAQKTTLR